MSVRLRRKRRKWQPTLVDLRKEIEMAMGRAKILPKHPSCAVFTTLWRSRWAVPVICFRIIERIFSESAACVRLKKVDRRHGFRL